MKASHPIADIFPLMQGAAFNAFCADVTTNGLRVPITLHPDGRILDGRNRYRACKAVGIEAQYETWDGEAGNELAYVLSLNLSRRHLDESQRAMVAARLATMPQGARTDLASIDAKTQPEAADLLNVSRPSVQRARVVLDTGTPELIEAVEQGQIAVSQGVNVAKAPEKTQRRVVEKVKAGAQPIEAMRQVRAEEINERQIEAPTGKYRIIYADPPWGYGNRMPPGSTEPRDYYPTMELADICALPIRKMAEDDAVLFLWVTSPLLPECFAVIAAWGFTYKASFVWDKVMHNLGHYNSVRHEFLLICTRGSCQPDDRRLFDSVVTEERTTHSTKPEKFRQIIDTLYPYGKHIELFARREVAGWETHGNELFRPTAQREEAISLVPEVA